MTFMVDNKLSASWLEAFRDPCLASSQMLKHGVWGEPGCPGSQLLCLHLLPSTLQAKVTEECSQYEFENYMRQQLLLAEEKSSIHEARSWVPKRQFGSVPPVRRLGHDAQPMTSLDTAILAQRYLRK